MSRLNFVTASIRLAMACIVVLFASGFHPAIAGCNPFGCSKSSVADCNPFGCPNPPSGAECTPFGCPDSPEPTGQRQRGEEHAPIHMKSDFQVCVESGESARYCSQFR